jgi:O-antigen/teichoic acid export membrane protein
MTRIELFQSLKRSELLKNTSILISGTVLAQLIPILLRPVLSRSFEPEVFGVYSVYASIFGIMCVIATLRYEMAIVLPKKDKIAANIVFLTILINFCFTILLILILLFWGKRICRQLNIPESLSYYIYFVPAGTFLYTFYQSLNFWLIRKKRFMPISFNKFFRRGAEGTVQIAFSFSKLSSGLIAGDIAGHLSNVISGIYQSTRSGLSIKYFSWNKLKYAFSHYSDYPKFNLISGLMSSVSFMLPVIIVNKFYSAENTGFFDLSRLLLSIPLALIASSLASVLLQRLTEKNNNREGLLGDLFPIFILLLSIAIFELVVIEFFGVGLFKLLFGNRWGYSGEISQILVWSYAFNFIVSSFSGVFIALNKIKLLSIWQFVYFVSISSLFMFTGRSFISFLKVYVFIEIACYLLYSFLLIRIVQKYELRRKLKT